MYNSSLAKSTSGSFAEHQSMSLCGGENCVMFVNKAISFFSLVSVLEEITVLIQ